MAKNLYNMQVGGRTTAVMLDDDYAARHGLQALAPNADPSGGGGGVGNAPDTGAQGAGNAPEPMPAPQGGQGGMSGLGPEPWGNTQGQRGIEPERPPETPDAPSPAAQPDSREVELDDLLAGAGAQQRQQQYAPPHLVKGGDRLVQYTQQTGLPVTEEQKQEFGEIAKAREQAARTMATVNETRALEQRDAQLALAKKQELELADARKQRAQIDREMESKKALVDQYTQEINAEKPATAEQMWKEKGWLSKFAAALSIAIGGARTNGPNPGLEIVNGFTSQWIADQKTMSTERKGKREKVQNEYDKMLARFGDEASATEALKMKANALHQRQIELRMAAPKPPEVQAGLQAVLADLKEQNLQSQLKLTALQQGQRTEQHVIVPDRYVGGGPAGGKPKAIDRMVRLPNGEYMWARTGKAAEAAQEQISANAEMVNLVDELDALANKPNAKGSGDIRGKIRTSLGRLKDVYRIKGKGGTLDAGMQAHLEDMTGNPNSFFDVSSRAQLNQLRAMSVRDNRQIIKSNLHYDPDAATSVEVGPEGKRVR